MAKNPLVVLRVGYMERYDGPDEISGGGEYVRENGVGGEVYNFKPSRGTCYGYAMSTSFGGINLNLVSDIDGWEDGDKLTGMDVVFIAKRPGYGQVVVGWYRNATVFHKEYKERPGRIRGMGDARRLYLCTADAEDAHLLPEDDRTFEVPNAPAGNKGFPGQSNVWYPTNNFDHDEVKSFTSKLRRYINKTTQALKLSDESIDDDLEGKRGRKRSPDHAHNVEVELQAILAVTEKYSKAGYLVHSVEKDNCGWDLVAKKGHQTLHLEVKGVSGETIYFELTPNEYGMLKRHYERYRVCVVCEALTQPRIHEFTPFFVSKSQQWKLRSIDKGVVVELTERIAAVGTELRIV